MKTRLAVRRPLGLRVCLALLVSVIAQVAFSQLPGAAAPGDQSGSLDVTPARIAVVVDESGSLGQAGVQAERGAAALLAEAELAPGSQMAIIGFGSSNSQGQNAVDQYCPLTTLSTPSARQLVANCAQQIHERSVNEGNDTDHVAALRTAINQLNVGPSASLKLIFLLTDGVLDVSNSPQYGANASERNQEANRQLAQDVLPTAKQSGIEIWPLGFGSADQAALTNFAEGGAGPAAQCAAQPTATPTATVVSSPADVSLAFLRALASARCATVGAVGSARLPNSGKTVDLSVSIPAIATDGSLTVIKGDPTVQVVFLDPEGHDVPTSGSFDASDFSLSGQNSPVEALHIRDPRPGAWKVRLTATDTSAGALVSATAIWEGVVRSSIVLTPTVPRPGGGVTVAVRLLSRRGVVVDPAALAGLHFSATASGAGFQPVTVLLRDDGLAPGDKTEGGVYKGSFILPSTAAGNGQVVAVVSGVGVASDTRPIYFHIPTGAILDAQLTLPSSVSLHPGGTITGLLQVTNDGSPLTGSLALTDLSAGTLATVTPSSVQLATGRSQISFRISFSRQSGTGRFTGVVQVADAKGTPLTMAFFQATIKATPPWLSSHLGLLLLVLVLLAVVAVLLRSVSQRRARQLAAKGLRAVVTMNGEDLGSLDAKATGRDFVILMHRGDDDSWELRRGNLTDPEAIIIRRTDHGQLAVTSRGTGAVSVTPGEPIEINDGGLSLTVTDQRKRRLTPATPGKSAAPSPPPPPVATETSSDLL